MEVIKKNFRKSRENGKFSNILRFFYEGDCTGLKLTLGWLTHLTFNL